MSTRSSPPDPMEPTTMIEIHPHTLSEQTQGTDNHLKILSVSNSSNTEIPYVYDREILHPHRAKTLPTPDHAMVAQGAHGADPAMDGMGNVQSTCIQSGMQRHNSHNHEDEEYTQRSCFPRARHRVGHMIETRSAHIAILLLTLIDIILVMLQIGASLLHLDETKEEEWFIALFGHLSLAIVCLFMFEILLKIFAFGPRYFWRGTPHWILHLVDAIIIFTSFMLEIFLHGAEQELSSLLIIFRLWRVVKLTGTVAVEVSVHEQARTAALETRVKDLEKELEESHLKIQRLELFNVSSQA